MKLSAPVKGLIAITAGILVIALLWTTIVELFFDIKLNQSKPLKLEYVLINMFVEDVNGTIEYYENIFDEDFKLRKSKENNDEYATFQIDNVNFIIQSYDNYIKLFEESDMQDKPYLQKHFSISVSNIDSLYSKIKHKSNVISPLRKTFKTANEFSIIDVNGYILTFIEASKINNPSLEN